MAHEHIVYMMLAESAVQARDALGLEEYTPRLEALAARDNHRPYLAVALRAWGVLHRLRGDPDQALERLNQAFEIFQELGFRWQIGRTCFELESWSWHARMLRERASISPAP